MTSTEHENPNRLRAAIDLLESTAYNRGLRFGVATSDERAHNHREQDNARAILIARFDAMLEQLRRSRQVNNLHRDLAREALGAAADAIERQDLVRSVCTRLTTVDAALRSASDERDLLRARVDSLDSALRDRRARIEELDRDLEQAQTRAAAAEAELAQRESHDDDDNDERNPR